MEEKTLKPDFILLNAGFARLGSEWNYCNVCSPFARIYFIEEGEARIIREKSVVTLRPGCLYLTPPFAIHSYACDNTFSVSYVHMYERPVGMSIFEKYDFPAEVQAETIDGVLFSRLLEINPGRELATPDPSQYDNSFTLFNIIAQNDDVNFATKIETQAIMLMIFSRFMAGLSDKTASIDKRIYRVLLYINNNVGEPMPISDLADVCCTSEDYFIRLFRKEMNCTPVDYINRKRIEKAQLMMVINNISIKEIASQAGFENISYFFRLFRKLTGHTPREMRAARSYPEIALANTNNKKL
jgi:AraC-like DNA-binding protein